MQENGHFDATHNELHPTQYLGGRRPEGQLNEIALIILNSPLYDHNLLKRLYEHASYRICADGGANRLHDLLTAQWPESEWEAALGSALPNAIHGDLDSLRDSVRDRYRDLGVHVTQDTDKYSTDFGKAINMVIADVPDIQDMLVLGSVGGRVDQGIGLLHELYREQKYKHPSVRFWLFSETSVTVLIRPGTTVVHTPLTDGLITCNIGILPLYGKAHITTQGLEWDVEDWPTELGGQVSTSNHIMEDQISITTDKDVLFTVERGAGD